MLQVYVRAYRLHVLTNKICQMLQSWDKLLSASSSTKIHRDCRITVRSRVNLSNIKQKCGPLPTGSVNLNKLNLIEIELFISKCFMGSGLLYNPTTIQTNLRAGCKSALQPRNDDKSPIWKQKHLKTSDIFSLPRISRKDFSYIKGKIDWSIGIN